MIDHRLLFVILVLCWPGNSSEAGPKRFWRRPAPIRSEPTVAEASGRRPHPKGYVAFRIPSAIQIDGRLDDLAWQAAPWTDEFVDIEGDKSKKTRPRFRTRAKMLWDDEFLYIAAQLDEPHVWGTLVKHDSVIFHDNDFEVFIDPDGDNHRYGEFEINALNTGWDLFLPVPYKDGGKADDGWEIPGLKTAIHVDGTLNDPRDVDRGWSVELALPWAVLIKLQENPPGRRPTNGDTWRINFSRVEWLHEIVAGAYRKTPDRREDNWVWSPQGVIDMHRPERWGYLQFSTRTAGSAEARDVRFRPDPTNAARDVLQRVYDAQHAFRKTHERFAATLRELELDGLTDRSLTGPVTLDASIDRFSASVEVRLPDGRRQRGEIRQNAQLRFESPKS